MEPQWNPMAEEQALSRIHRMGQTQPVQTIRYIVRGSIEEVSERSLRWSEISSSNSRSFLLSSSWFNFNFLMPPSFPNPPLVIQPRFLFGEEQYST